ncbi:MAG: HAD hydrolase family protein [Bifidobacterium longum]|nr:HAD hydrolase family protein [Bifidobacterium longum]
MTQEDVHFIDKSAESEVGSPVGSAVFVPTLSEPGLLVMDVDSANRLEVADGCLTGKVLGEIVSKTVKLHALQTWADRLGIPMSQTVAVGDGANDIPMIQAAGLGLAFCAKPKTQLAADKAINDRDLTHVLDYLRR